MSGVKLSVNNRRFKCNIELVDKVTVIIGDSGTGKTAFVKKLYQNFEGVSVSNDYSIAVFDTIIFNRIVKQANSFRGDLTLKEYWKDQSRLPATHSVVIVDDEDFIKSKEFVIFFENSQDNYFLFINRSKIGSIQYDVKSIYKMKQEGIEHILVPVYSMAKMKRDKMDLFLVEDSGSGYTFFKSMYKNKVVVNASYGLMEGEVSGKDNVIHAIQKLDKDFPGKNILLLVDYSAFGNNIMEIVKVLSSLRINIYFYFNYQSFEYMLLKSKLIDDTEIQEILDNNVLKFRSKEQLYFERLKELTKNTEYQYNKSEKSFPVCYYVDCCSKQRPIFCDHFNKNKNKDKFEFLLEDTEFSGLLNYR